MHAYKSFDTRVLSIRSMDSHDQYAQRIEESAESGRSVGASHAQSEQSVSPEPADRLQGKNQDLVFGSSESFAVLEQSIFMVPRIQLRLELG